MPNHTPDLPKYLKQGEPARLIPTGAESSKERRTTSSLLAALMSVEDFGQFLLRMVGAPATKRARITCYTEVVFNGSKGDPNFRPDGMILVDNGSKSWSAIVEAKVGGAELDQAQVECYLDIAKAQGVDAVITISNQFAALPTHHPVPVDKRKTRSVALYHWSWMSVMSVAEILSDHGGIEHRGRAFILSELLRYLQDASSGVASGMRMGPGWREVCMAAQQGAKLTKGADEVISAVGDWHQLLRYLSLQIGRMIGSSVSVQMPRKHVADPAARLQDTIVELIQDHQIEAAFEIPNAAARLWLSADLNRRTLTASMQLKAPTDKSRATACVTWLLNQLGKCDDPEVIIRAKWPGRAPDTQATLGQLREDRTAILSLNKALMPTAFEVCEVRDVAARIKGAKTFVEEAEGIVTAFYRSVGQNLKAWVPPPPKMAKAAVTESAATAKGDIAEVPPREQEAIAPSSVGV